MHTDSFFLKRNGSLIINRTNRAPSERLDPSKIIITKPVVSRTASVKKTDRGSESLVIQSKISKPHVAAPDTKPKPKQHTQPTKKQRPRSSPPQPQQATAAIPEPEKKIVLVCNLDPRATAEDVGVRVRARGCVSRLCIDFLVELGGMLHVWTHSQL